MYASNLINFIFVLVKIVKYLERMNRREKIGVRNTNTSTKQKYVKMQVESQIQLQMQIQSIWSRREKIFESDVEATSFPGWLSCKPAHCQSLTQIFLDPFFTTFRT